MSKIFGKALRVSPVILGAILGFANNTYGSEAPTTGFTLNKIVAATDKPTSSLKQNIHTQESNTLTQVMPVSQQLDVNPTVVMTSTIILVEDSAARTTQEKAVITTDQPTTINLPESIPRQTEDSDTLTQVIPVTEQFNLTLPNYSLKASDLLDTSSPVSKSSQYRLPDSTPSKPISETVTQNLNQPGNRVLAQDEKPKAGESEAKPDKSQYNLFNPTPRALWREFSTDRPDKTETPFTVDAGNYTMEADLFIYTRDTNSPDGTRTESFNFFVPNFKVGLTNNIDLQIIPEVYNIVRTTPKGGSHEEASGFGDITVRVKVNFFGNDGGKYALGMMPFIKIPTNQNNLGNNSIEGGIIFPFAISLSEKWDVGMQTEFDLNKNQDASGYNVGFVNTVSFGYQIDSKWSTYFELFTKKTTERGADFVATFDTGLKYLLTENVQLDAGINIGLTQAADDLQPFVGLSVRF